LTALAGFRTGREDLDSYGSRCSAVAIAGLMSGQFNDPLRVVAFNTAERWAHDVSRDIALEIQTRCDINDHDVPETRFATLSIATPVLIGSSPCGSPKPCPMPSHGSREMRFAHLKRILKLGRLRLRGPRGAQDEFVLAAVAQNLRRLTTLVARPPPAQVLCIA
jgi:hypothetical protein